MLRFDVACPFFLTDPQWRHHQGAMSSCLTISLAWWNICFFFFFRRCLVQPLRLWTIFSSFRMIKVHLYSLHLHSMKFFQRFIFVYKTSVIVYLIILLCNCFLFQVKFQLSRRKNNWKSNVLFALNEIALSDNLFSVIPVNRIYFRGEYDFFFPRTFNDHEIAMFKYTIFSIVSMIYAAMCNRKLNKSAHNERYFIVRHVMTRTAKT